MKIIERVRELLEAEIVKLDYILDEVIYEKEGSVYYLRLVIDKQGLVDVNDCVKVSELVNPILDNADIIKDSYILDVCSKEKGE